MLKLQTQKMRNMFNKLYQGHYILLVGYDEFTSSVLYRDPAAAKSIPPHLRKQNYKSEPLKFTDKFKFVCKF